MELFNKVNLKQFETLKYIIDNVQDDHIMCKINCEIRSDKIDAPYYLDTEISISHCTGMYNKGILHAMDVFKHHRMYNLRENKYNEIRDIIENNFSSEFKCITTEFSDEAYIIKIEVMEVSDLQDIFAEYNEFFKIIDDLA
ncbi:MAG: hypothetical protein BZ135_01545 [Methanosphaera sp. rholeuAM6]|nr:MAG: hypothetical protein BZ135_01545 [Methanosphaera sp. rholeuAM6]